jgi:hypothetical protein
MGTIVFTLQLDLSDRLFTVSHRLLNQGEHLMALAQSTQEKLDAIFATLTSVREELATAATGLAGDIAALKAAVPDPTPDFNAALDNIAAKADAFRAVATTLSNLDALTPPSA